MADIEHEIPEPGRTNLNPLSSQEEGPPLAREVSYQDATSVVQSHQNTAFNTEKIVITFHSTDPDNPTNWPGRKKGLVVFAGLATVLNSTLGSSLPSGAIDKIAEDFSITNELHLVLPISVYLLGYVLGPIFCGPLSEQYGRKPVMLISFMLYTIFTMACALASNFPSLLVFRLLCGVNASAPIAIVGGLYADVYHNPRKRGYSMAWFMVVTNLGPSFGPMLSGFISTVSWRWTFWLGLILAGVTMPCVILMPESYAPVLLHIKAKRLRKQTGNPNILAKSELDPQTWTYVITSVLTRPFRMFVFESIVLFSCLYLSLAYSIFYLFFQAYPLIFEGPESIYKMTPGIAGLAFLPICVGSILCLGVFYAWDAYLQRARAQHKRWAGIEEYRRVPLACFGGPAIVVALFWLGWTAKPEIHWIVPMLSGVPYGLGFLLIFMALLNYITDAYETFAASALGMTSTCRSIFGALLPLAANRMYGTLGISWASSLLGFASLGMAIIPFAFIRYGERIRAGSRFCRELKEMAEQEKKEEEQYEEEQRRQSRQCGEAGINNDRDNARSNSSSSRSSRPSAAGVSSHGSTAVVSQSGAEGQLDNISSDTTLEKEKEQEKESLGIDEKDLEKDLEKGL